MERQVVMRLERSNLTEVKNENLLEIYVTTYTQTSCKKIGLAKVLCSNIACSSGSYCGRKRIRV